MACFLPCRALSPTPEKRTPEPETRNHKPPTIPLFSEKAHVRPPRQDSGLGFQVQVFETFFKLFPLRSDAVHVRLPGRGNSNSHGARSVRLITWMIKWIRTKTMRRCCEGTWWRQSSVVPLVFPLGWLVSPLCSEAEPEACSGAAEHVVQPEPVQVPKGLARTHLLLDRLVEVAQRVSEVCLHHVPSQHLCALWAPKMQKK